MTHGPGRVAIFIWIYCDIAKCCSNFQKYRALDAQVRQFYFGNLPIDNSTRANYIDLLSDISFVYDCVKTARIHSQKSLGRTYFYM